MNSILITPRNEEEFSFINQFLSKIKVKSTVLTEEDIDDIQAFDKAIRKVKNGRAEFFSLDEVKNKLSVS